jgi:hypothetical protein
MLSEPKAVGCFEEHTLPNGGCVYYEPDKHQYFGEVKAKPNGDYSYVRDSRLMGVSTIAKYLDPNADPLMHWAAKLDQVGIAEMASQCLDNGENLDWLRYQGSIAQTLREAEVSWSHVRNRAAMRGTNVHERIFLTLAADTEPPSLSGLSEEERGYGQAAFAWWRDRKPEPVAAEYVTADLALGVAGRPDLLADIEGARVLVDAKTRAKARTYKSDHVQLRGYKATNLACGVGESKREIVLVLLPDGTYQEFEGVGTDADFHSALLACKSGKHLDRRMREASKAREVVTV